MPWKIETDQEYILSRIEIDFNGCWNWKLVKDRQGYGYGSRCGENRSHRASYRIFKGEIPEGIFVCHACDNPSCCNPEHLFLGSARENNIDRIKKERFVGEKQATSIYTDAEIQNVFDLREQGLPITKIAEQTGMSMTHISGTLKGTRRSSAHRNEPDISFKRKLTTGQVCEIRKLISEGYSSRAIAITFNITHKTVLDIKNGKTWAEL